MEIEAVLAITMFLTTLAALLAGYPVAFTLGGVSLIFAFIGIQLGVFRAGELNGLFLRIEGIMENAVLLAVPLFVIMGVVLERSKVAEDLLHVASRLLGRVRGGLGYAVVLVGALLAASTGIVGATVISMTLIALPTMLRQGYDVRLSTGTIAASGTLGQIIPPSIVLILLADAISNASSRASLSGAGSGAVSVQDLFSGALIPGLILVGIYLGWIAFNAAFRPQTCPPISDPADHVPLTAKEVLFGLGAPLLLIFAVLGSILSGLAPPTEAAAIGAVGAVLLAGLRLSPDEAKTSPFIILAGLVGAVLILVLSNTLDLRVTTDNRTAIDMIGIVLAGLSCVAMLLALLQSARVLHREEQFFPSLKSAAHITTMVFTILIGATLFALVFSGFYGDELVEDVLTTIPGGKWGMLIACMLLMFILGFFLDFIEIIFIIVPLVAPPLIMAGFDPVWLGILMALNLQTSFLTPPFGFALFYLRGSAPEGVQTLDIWRGAIPFIGFQLSVICLVAAIPSLATWLPSVVD